MKFGLITEYTRHIWNAYLSRRWNALHLGKIVNLSLELWHLNCVLVVDNRCLHGKNCALTAEPFIAGEGAWPINEPTWDMLHPVINRILTIGPSSGRPRVMHVSKLLTLSVVTVSVHSWHLDAWTCPAAAIQWFLKPSCNQLKPPCPFCITEAFITPRISWSIGHKCSTIKQR